MLPLVTPGNLPRRPFVVLALTLLLAAPLLAGCLSLGSTDQGPAARRPLAHELAGARLGPDGLSAKVYDTVRHEVTNITAFDGAKLAVDVWRPETPAGAKVPVVAVLSPYMGNEVTGYRKDPAKENYPTSYGPYRFLVEKLVPAGYAVALVDLRGTRHSEGCIDLGGAKEQQDAYTIVEWLGTQEWSSGRVGMLGKSYDGLTAVEAAVMRAPHLVTFVPMAPVSSWYQVEYMGGTHYTTWTATPGIYTAIDNTYVKGAGPSGTGWARSGADQWQCAAQNSAHSNHPTGDNTPYLQERDLRPRAGNVTASMFWVHGFLDVNAKVDNMGDFYPQVTAPKKGYFWQAPHEWPTYEYNRTEEGKREEWSGRLDFWPTVHRWFDYWLLELDNGMDRELNVQVQDNLGRWRNETAWPPADAATTSLYLSAGNLTTLTPRVYSESYTDDNGRGDLLDLLNQSAPLPGTSALRYTGEPLAAPLHTSGTPTVTLTLRADRPNTHYLAYLYDVDADGTWNLVNKGALNLRHRHGIDHPATYAPNTQETLTVSLYPQDFVFQPGHRIGLVVRSSDPLWVVPSGTSATTTVTYGGDAPSRLDLPVITRDASATWLTTWGEKQVPYLGEVEGGSATLDRPTPAGVGRVEGGSA